jgi:hypothetical protein
MRVLTRAGLLGGGAALGAGVLASGAGAAHQHPDTVLPQSRSVTIDPTGGVNVLQGGSPWLGFERFFTDREPQGTEPRVDVGHVLVTVQDTLLYGLSGSYAHWINKPSSGYQHAQTLVVVVVHENDPGDGPFVGFQPLFNAQGKRAPLWHYNARLAVPANSVGSDGTPILVDFQRPIEMPEGLMLSVYAAVNYFSSAEYSFYSYEVQLDCMTDFEMARVRWPPKT